MTATDILAELQRRGVSLTLDGDGGTHLKGWVRIETLSLTPSIQTYRVTQDGSVEGLYHWQRPICLTNASDL